MNSLHTSIHETISDLSWLASLPKEPLSSALAYHRYGWHPIPLRFDSKAPKALGWRQT